MYTLGYNSVKKFTPMARIFSFIIPPKRSVPPFWSCVYGTEGLILMPRYSKYSVICSFCVTILLSYSSTVGDTFYWASIFVKKYWSVKIIDSAVLLLR